MPEFTWFFDKQKRPNKKGLAMLTYMQWLGSWSNHKPDEITASMPKETRGEVEAPKPQVP
jgi:hypothetical protein